MSGAFGKRVLDNHAKLKLQIVEFIQDNVPPTGTLLKSATDVRTLV